MQELSNSIKTPNLRIIGIKGEEVQTKGIHNIFNKIMAGNLPNLKKELPVQVQEASRTSNRLNQNRTLNVNRLNSSIRRHHLANWVKKEDQTICCLQETCLIERNKHWLCSEWLEEDLPS
jgi:hypothetical protein